MKHNNCHILSHTNHSASARNTAHFGASLHTSLGSKKEPTGKVLKTGSVAAVYPSMLTVVFRLLLLVVILILSYLPKGSINKPLPPYFKFPFME